MKSCIRIAVAARGSDDVDLLAECMVIGFARTPELIRRIIRQRLVRGGDNSNADEAFFGDEEAPLPGVDGPDQAALMKTMVGEWRPDELAELLRRVSRSTCDCCEVTLVGPDPLSCDGLPSSHVWVYGVVCAFLHVVLRLLPFALSPTWQH